MKLGKRATRKRKQSSDRRETSDEGASKKKGKGDGETLNKSSRLAGIRNRFLKRGNGNHLAPKYPKMGLFQERGCAILSVFVRGPTPYLPPFTDGLTG